MRYNEVNNNIYIDTYTVYIYIVIIYIRLAAPLLFLCTNICLNRGTTISFQCLKHFLKKNLTEGLWLCGARGWLTVWHKYGEKVPVKPGTVEDADICYLALGFEFAMQLFANAWSHQHLRTDLSSGCQYPGILGMGTKFQLLAAVICHSNDPKLLLRKTAVQRVPVSTPTRRVRPPALFQHLGCFLMKWTGTEHTHMAIMASTQIHPLCYPKNAKYPMLWRHPGVLLHHQWTPKELFAHLHCPSDVNAATSATWQTNGAKYHIAPSNFRVRQV
jgi:hypothetical protein